MVEDLLVEKSMKNFQWRLDYGHRASFQFQDTEHRAKDDYRGAGIRREIQFDRTCFFAGINRDFQVRNVSPRNRIFLFLEDRESSTNIPQEFIPLK